MTAKLPEKFTVEFQTTPHWATVRGRVWLLIPRWLYVAMPFVFFGLGVLEGKLLP